jgi:4-alpha-glucanotransferase
LGQEARAFVDFVAKSGATIWQILPLTPNGRYDSPYFSYTTFAGNPWLIDLQALIDAGLLDKAPLYAEPRDHRIPFPELPKKKMPLLRQAAERFLATPKHAWQAEFQAWRTKQAWLEDTAHFYALKEQFRDAKWWDWDAPARERKAAWVQTSKRELAQRIAVYEALFFFVDHQWAELKAYANSKGIRILGDLPIYVDGDSVDVWLYQDQFKLDSKGQPIVVSGVPPDYFSETGQLWGNPIYDWKKMAQDGFAWWVARLARTLELADIVRIDHFRALSAYWEIPGDAKDARSGKWVPGPGQAFFDTLEKHFPNLPFVAEDLGTLDDEVYALRDDNGLYGMRILQFGFDGMPDNVHQPHQFTEATIAYTGTHDNDTVAGWWSTLSPEQKQEVAAYYQFSPDADAGRVAWSFIEATIASRANVAVIPVPDLLVLDRRARMNDPATFVGNWSWRMPPDGLSDELAASVRELRDRYRPLTEPLKPHVPAPVQQPARAPASAAPVSQPAPRASTPPVAVALPKSAPPSNRTGAASASVPPIPKAPATPSSAPVGKPSDAPKKR